MYNGVGLLTARGSGTSGHVQTNSFNIRNRPWQDVNTREKKLERVKKPDERILEHERKRAVELELVELAEELEEKGYGHGSLTQPIGTVRECILVSAPLLMTPLGLVLSHNLRWAHSSRSAAGTPRLKLIAKSTKKGLNSTNSSPL